MNDRTLGPGAPRATVAVFSDGFAGSIVESALSAIGCRVLILPLLGWREAYETLWAEWDAVVVDRIGSVADASYLADVARVNRAAWITMSSFGLGGPLSDYRGSDLVCGAAGGLVSALRDGAGRPQPVPGNQALIDIGQAAALAVLDGINRVRTDGVPVHLDLSGQESVAFSTAHQECAHVLYDCAGPGGVTRYSAPSGLFSCRDGMVRIIVIDDHQWLRFAAATEKPEWEQQFATIDRRREHADEITSMVADWTRHRSKFECEEILQSHGVAATAVRSWAEVADCAQFTFRRFAPGLAGPADTTRTLPAIIAARAEGVDGATTAERGRRTLADLKVLEISNVLAVPLAGSILGALGAQVVRLEDLDRLDVYRRNGPFAQRVPGPERAAYFLGANYEKRSVAGRFAGDDRPVLDELLNWCDVVLENIGAARLKALGVAERLGRPETTGKLVVSVSGFGQAGPHGHFKGYAGNFHAYAGLDDLVSSTRGSDCVLKTALADYDTAIWVALVIGAWGMGNRPGLSVDLSMSEVVAHRVMKGAVHASDSNPVHARLIEVRPGEYAAFDGRTTQPAVARAQEEGVPAYECVTPAGLVTDPQLTHRRFFIECPHSIVDGARVLALPWKPVERDRDAYRPAPLLGQDNAWLESSLRTWSR